MILLQRCSAATALPSKPMQGVFAHPNWAKICIWKPFVHGLSKILPKTQTHRVNAKKKPWCIKSSVP
jgi:hypothetical protein